MSENTVQNIYWQKTFFIAPVREMVPEEYLQDYLSHGYECYIIPDDGTFPVKEKVQAVISLFPGSLLIFDTTHGVNDIEWETYIQTLQLTCGDKAKIAVIYSELWDNRKRTHFKSWYTDYARVEGGLIGLEPDSIKNFERIKKILVSNKVLGRRKAVRASCTSDCGVSFSYGSDTYTGTLADISISHFCADVDMKGTTLPVYEKIKDAVLIINGVQFSTDIVLILRRGMDNSAKCVFMFIKQGGLPGLSGGKEERLSPQIYNIISKQCSDAINRRLTGNA